jgi:hypothetical protein
MISLIFIYALNFLGLCAQSPPLILNTVLTPFLYFTISTNIPPFIDNLQVFLNLLKWIVL